MGVFDDLFKKHKKNENLYNSNNRSLKIFVAACFNYKSGNYVSAIANATEAINENPLNVNFFTLRGTSYEALGNLTEAEADFKKALQLQPTEFVASSRLSLICAKRNDLESAIKWLTVSYRDAPDRVDEDDWNNILFTEKYIIASNLGNLLIQTKKVEEGIQYLDESIKIEPRFANSHFSKGLGLMKIGKSKEALTSLETALALGHSEALEAINIVKDSIEIPPKSNL